MGMSSYSSFQMHFVFLSPGPHFCPKANGSCRKSSSSHHCRSAGCSAVGQSQNPSEEAWAAASTEHPAEPGPAKPSPDEPDRDPRPGRGELRQQQFVGQRGGGDAPAAPQTWSVLPRRCSQSCWPVQGGVSVCLFLSHGTCITFT